MFSLRSPFFVDHDTDFGFGHPLSARHPWDLDIPVTLRQLNNLSRRGLLSDQGNFQAVAKTDAKKFDLKVLMPHFRPEDIKVKVEGNNVTVEASREHEKKEDGSYSYSLRKMRKSYPIPEGVDKAKLSSAFTKNDVLEIEAPMLETRKIEEAPAKTVIEVTHVNDE